MKVFLFIPNLVGYIRLLLVIFAYSVRNENFGLFAISYFVSFILDAADGFAARLFKQETKFGAVLDLITDRMSTLVIVLIAVQNREDVFVTYFVAWIVIDISSHWIQMLNAVASGKHHKSMNNRFFLLNLYYSQTYVMLPLCLGAESFFLLHLFKTTHESAGAVFNIIYYICLALMSIKGYINVLQLISNCMILAEQDEKRIEQAN